MPKGRGDRSGLRRSGKTAATILNVTIHYPQGAKNFWPFFCGEVNEVVVRVEKIPITKEVLGDYFNDSKFKSWSQNWLNGLWEKKDACLTDLAQSKNTTGREN